MSQKSYLCRRIEQHNGQMVKQILTATTFLALSNVALAGGFLTNTNQSASFLRMPAQEGVISVEGAYYNPAGVGFLSNGWHMAFNIQSAYQHRNATSTFAPYALGVDNNGATTKLFQGKASAPILPSFDLVFVKDRWFGSFHFGLTGGGGKATYENGLGSFESTIATVPTIVNAMGLSALSIGGYDFDSYMHGRQYHFGAQFGAGYRVTDNFSVSAGARIVYATASYSGFVNDIQYSVGGTMMRASQIPVLQNIPLLAEGINLEAKQKGWGVTPIIGVNWKINDQWNIGAKYEFKTRLRLNTTSNVTPTATAYSVASLAKFRDGTKMANDIPAIAALGVQYSPTNRLRLNLASHVYFDKQATQYNNEQEKLAGNSWEILAGAEYDINDRWTASLGGQRTDYGLGKNSLYISDMSFNTDSYSFGLGVKYKVNDRISINASYFKTFYNAYTRTADDYNNVGATFSALGTAMGTKLQAQLAALTAAGQTGTAAYQQAATAYALVSNIPTVVTGLNTAGTLKGADHFDRTNDVFGIGVDIRF